MRANLDNTLETLENRASRLQRERDEAFSLLRSAVDSATSTPIGWDSRGKLIYPIWYGPAKKLLGDI